jgi:hypothetical protein
LKNKKNLHAETLRNDPFPYCHLYNLLVGNDHGKDWMQYVLHCDYPQPSDRRNLSEIKRRMNWSIRPLTIFKINILKKDYVSGKTSKNIKLMDA